MIDLIVRYIMPTAYSLLPAAMASSAATANLLAIGLQESRFLDRRQRGGPACGFWQFEIPGVRGVLEHERSREVIRDVLRLLRYDPAMTAHELQPRLADNDVLAACFARCLLWTSRSTPLPLVDESDLAWIIYLDTWRPGRPRRESWRSLYAEAWGRVVATNHEQRA